MTIGISVYDPNQTTIGQKQFDCGHTAINAFVHSSLKPQVKRNLSVAYVLSDFAKEDRFVGFYTIAQHMVDFGQLSGSMLGSMPRKIPCTRLIMLGIDKQYQGQKLGSRLMRHALSISQQVAQEIGSFGLYLDADPTALNFYKKLGFTQLEIDRPTLPSPMFLCIERIF
ncbi:MAG: GNAT family N-acetyltransferase [Burkholderiales bacterium]|nr:GNAT family N-acetyltransferase [Burkholderiales bacterium]